MARPQQIKEAPLMLLTHPNGQPVEVRATVAETLLKRGYKKGYTVKKERKPKE